MWLLLQGRKSQIGESMDSVAGSHVLVSVRLGRLRDAAVSMSLQQESMVRLHDRCASSKASHLQVAGPLLNDHLVCGAETLAQH